LIETVHIYHTNDLHSHFENWPKIVHYLKTKKHIHKSKNETVFLFDIGDHVDRFHPITEATGGVANVELLNHLTPDAITIGNNEGITLPFEALDRLYNHAQFPVIVSNLFYLDGTRPKWAKPYVIKHLQNGVRIGILGVTVCFEQFYRQLGWMITEPMANIKETLEEIRGKADVIILLSHLGISDDEWIAQQFPDIDVILGAHTHHVLDRGKLVGNTLLAGAGKFGQWLGHIELKIDSAQKKLVNKKAEIIETKTIEKEDVFTIKWLDQKKAESAQKLNEAVVELKEELRIDWFSDSPFAKLLASALKEWCDGEVSMVNAGVLLESLPKGLVTKGDLHRICPHPINPCKIMVQGDQLKEVILQARTKEMEQLKLKGLGFRGKVMGRMVFDGIETVMETLEDGKEHVKKIFVNGKRLDQNHVYAVATIDMFTLGPLYPQLSRVKNKIYFMPELLRDVLAWKLSKQFLQIHQ